jgi:ubiquinone/menaquinone biosynthesis C-methylase UbiE
MAENLCPFWVGYLLVSPVRRWFQNPERILGPYIKAGMTALDVGCAMGFFSLPIARMVGPDGRVVCVDIQERMLQALRRRALKAGVADRITARVCNQNSLGLRDLEGRIDFVIAFAVVHEVPDASAFLLDIFRVMKPDARCLVAEPKMHTSLKQFKRTICAAEEKGLAIVERPAVPASHAVLFGKRA